MTKIYNTDTHEIVELECVLNSQDTLVDVLGNNDVPTLQPWLKEGDPTWVFALPTEDIGRGRRWAQREETIYSAYMRAPSDLKLKCDEAGEIWENDLEVLQDQLEDLLGITDDERMAARLEHLISNHEADVNYEAVFPPLTLFIDTEDIDVRTWLAREFGAESGHVLGNDKTLSIECGNGQDYDKRLMPFVDRWCRAYIQVLFKPSDIDRENSTSLSSEARDVKKASDMLSFGDAVREIGSPQR